MNSDVLRIRGMSRYGLKARLKTKQAQSRWHFGPKTDANKEPVDRMVRRIRETGPLHER
jgi:hypothetical protein